MARLPKTRRGHTVIEKTRIGVHDVVGLLQNGETLDTLITNSCTTLGLVSSRVHVAPGSGQPLYSTSRKAVGLQSPKQAA
ncbi:MAG: DUF433 domain-containing protein [Acidobacteria bacterium]|nr:DUF433 domain-containing protein [Acidobacteriota bacterium]